jgi:flagellar assembly factor FliW
MNTSAAETVTSQHYLDVESHILGRLNIPAEECFEFPQGLFGFPACKRFAVVPTERPEFFWLQGMDCGSLAFLMADPFALVDGFYADMSEGNLLPLKAGKGSEISLLAIVTLPRSPEDVPTANLQGLLALNFEKRIGRQVIIQNSEYGTRWPLDPNRLKAAS